MPDTVLTNYNATNSTFFRLDGTINPLENPTDMQASVVGDTAFIGTPQNQQPGDERHGGIPASPAGIPGPPGAGTVTWTFFENANNAATPAPDFNPAQPTSLTFEFAGLGPGSITVTATDFDDNPIDVLITVNNVAGTQTLQTGEGSNPDNVITTLSGGTPAADLSGVTITSDPPGTHIKTLTLDVEGVINGGNPADNNQLFYQVTGYVSSPVNPTSTGDNVITGEEDDEVIEPDTFVDDDDEEVDNNDALGTHDNGTGGNDSGDDDSIQGNGGNDTINPGEGRDTVDGGADNDVINAVDDAIGDSLMGGAGTDSITAGAGDDTIDGGTGNDTINAGDGDDTITGGDDSDVIDGGAGADSIDAGRQSDSVDGGDGNDTIFGGNQNDTINGDAGNDSIDGGNNNDSIDGGTGNDNIDGGSGNDSIFGGGNNDTLAGNIGNDRFIYNNDGFNQDTITGGEDAGDGDVDVLDASAATTRSFDLDLSEGGANDPESGTLTLNSNNTVTFSEIESIILSDGADTVTGSGGADSVNTGAGNDSLSMGAGNDTVLAGDGADTIEGGTGNDSIDLGTDASDEVDTLVLNDGDGNDTVSNFKEPVLDGSGTPTEPNDMVDVSGLTKAGSTALVDTSDATVSVAGSDVTITFPDGTSITLTGLTNPSIFQGATQEDALVAIGIPRAGAPRDNVITGEAVGETISSGGFMDEDGEVVDGNDALGTHNNGAGGNDSGDDDSIRGNGGDDTINPGFGRDSVDGGADDDIITATSDTTGDSLLGGDGSDTILAGAGDDTIDGGNDGDSINGNSGEDSITGGAGADTINAGNDNDTVDGGLGDDTINGGTGDNVIDGGDGDDSISTSSGADSIDGGNGNDTINAGGGRADDTVNGGAGNDSIIGSNTFSNQTASPTLLADGGTGNDTITGSRGSDTISGGDDDDVIDGRQGADSIDGGDGNDSIVAGSANDTVFGGAGNDTIEDNNGDNTLDGGAGDDLFVVSGGFNTEHTIFGGDGNDTVSGSGNSNLLVNGDAGDDNLVGSDVQDSLSGGADDDTIDGQLGADTLIGGTGNDLFIYESGDGATTITDFNTNGEDVNLNDGDDSNNDYLDLTPFYSRLNDARADLEDNGRLDNSTGTVTSGQSINISLNGADSSVLTNDSTGLLCFAAGTLIETDRGEVAIEKLVAGDMVRTLTNGFQPVSWIGKRTLNAAHLRDNPKHCPVRIRAGALGAHQPAQDLYVSPQHRLLVSSDIVQRMLGETQVLVPAIKLVGTDGIDVMAPDEGVTYLHLLFDRHEVVFANGALSESLFTGPEALKSISAEARQELRDLMPDLFSIDYRAVSPWPMLNGKKAKTLVSRHAKNRKPLVDDRMKAA